MKLSFKLVAQLVKIVTDQQIDSLCLAKILSGRVEPPATGKRPDGWIIGRSALLYRWFDLASILPGERRTALRAQILAWSPFNKSGYRIIWFDASAGVFAWDAEKILQRAPEMANAHAETKRLFPESWLYPVPYQGGARLLQCLEGWEGQYWHDNSMRASRWWASLPDENEWLNFQRGAGVAATASRTRDLCQLGTLPIQNKGWGKISSFADLQQNSCAWEPVAVALASFVLIAFTANIAKDHYDLSRKLAAAESEVARLKKITAPVLKIREQALALQAEITQILNQLERQETILILNNLLEHLPKEGIEVKELELHNKDLRVLLSVADNVSRTAIVSGLEGSGAFLKVREGKSSPGGLLALTMEVGPVIRPVLEKKTETLPQSSISSGKPQSSAPSTAAKTTFPASMPPAAAAVLVKPAPQSIPANTTK